MLNRHFATINVRLLLLGGFVGLTAAILQPLFWRWGDRESPRSPCQTNLKQISLAIHVYAQDYDEQFPSVRGNGMAFGWADALAPYVKSVEVFQCYAAGRFSQDGKPSSLGYTDYWLSRRLAGRPLASINDVRESVLLGEGNDGTDMTNARYCYSSIPARWKADQNSPSYRHSGTGNTAFADGHVKALRPSDIDNPRWANGPTLK